MDLMLSTTDCSAYQDGLAARESEQRRFASNTKIRTKFLCLKAEFTVRHRLLQSLNNSSNNKANGRASTAFMQGSHPKQICMSSLHWPPLFGREKET